MIYFEGKRTQMWPHTMKLGLSQTTGTIVRRISTPHPSRHPKNQEVQRNSHTKAKNSFNSTSIKKNFYSYF